MAIQDSGSGAGDIAAGGGFYSNPSYASVPINATYADIGHAVLFITQALSDCNQLYADLEADLATYQLTITQDDSDALLLEAAKTIWPSTLGTPDYFISYYYYKYLQQLDSRAATFIRDRYEEAAQGETGTTSIDLLQIVKILLDELTLCQEFVNAYDGNLSDTSEHRAVENIQDFAKSASLHAGRLRSIFSTTATALSFSQTEVDALTAQESYSAQALFKVNLNKLNRDIAYVIRFLQKEFIDHASTFYNNCLGPALAFHLQVSAQISPIMPGRVGKEANAAKSSTDKNLAMILADQTRRLQNLELKMRELEVTLQMRNTYRTYLLQLTQTGAALPRGLSGTMIRGGSNSVADQFFQQAIHNIVPSADNFDAPHSALSGLGDPAAHPQYLLKAGGLLTGDLAVLPNVLVDKIHPSTHTHTGHDGSQQINGNDILPGTLSSGSVAATDQPGVPQNLRIVSQTVRLVGTTEVVDVTIAWDSEDGNTFDVQIAPIT